MRRTLLIPLAVLIAATSPAPADASVAASQIQFRGLLDLVTSSRGVALESNAFNYGDTNFDAYRLRLFAEGAVTKRLAVYTQLLFTDAAPVRALGAYASWTPVPERDLHLLAGKIPWVNGTYAPRSYSYKNPLVSTPLMYQYHTQLPADQLVPSVDALLAQAGPGQYGLVVSYDLCWDFGIAAVGSARPLEAAIAITNGTPGRMNAARDENDGKSFVGRVGVTPIPALRFGVSGSIGPYLLDALNPSLPSGTSAEDYDQRLAMADLELLFGHAELRGEAYRNFWDTPTVGTLSMSGYYVEGKYVLPFGTYAAARWEHMGFGDVTSSAGDRRPWHFPQRRLEVGAGCRLTRGVFLKAVYQEYSYEEWEAGETEEYSYPLYAAQLTTAF